MCQTLLVTIVFWTQTSLYRLVYVYNFVFVCSYYRRLSSLKTEGCRDANLVAIDSTTRCRYLRCHNNHDVIMSAMASQITSLTIVYLTVYSDQRKHLSSASLAFVRGIHRWPVNSPHKGPVTQKMFPFDDVFMTIVLSWWRLPVFQW